MAQGLYSQGWFSFAPQGLGPGLACPWAGEEKGTLELVHEQGLKLQDLGLVRRCFRKKKVLYKDIPSEGIERLSILKKSQPMNNQRFAVSIGALVDPDPARGLTRISPPPSAGLVL